MAQKMQFIKVCKNTINATELKLKTYSVAFY